MRYDTAVAFQTIDLVYKSNGDYEESVSEEHIEYGSVTDTDVQTMQLVYGGIKQGSITLHLQNKVDYPYDRIVIDGTPYVVDQLINLRVKQAYVLSEWQRSKSKDLSS